MVLKNIIYLFPAIVLVINDPIYACRNFAIEFRWVVFHARLLWMEENAE